MGGAADLALETVEHRVRIRVSGAVQGVGFRPFIYKLAKAHDLKGWVRNDSQGVLIEIEGKQADQFAAMIQELAPPLARIDRIDAELVPFETAQSFEIRPSSTGTLSTMIGGDACVCGSCLDEMFDPEDRRYLYPFLNCTHCGPRLTITKSLPYDRSKTSMTGFDLCQDCRTEYENPTDRRFHAQPTACKSCGPTLSHSIHEILDCILSGGIVAVKGIGGFHLVCDARNDSAVSALRARKNREAKPFAIMVLNSESAAQLVKVSPAERDLLEDKARPIVLCEALKNQGFSEGLAPGLSELGIVLPYAPLHFLLFQGASQNQTPFDWRREISGLALVMTSANPAGAPLVISNDDAQSHLSGIADLIVDHDRDILIRADDSVTKLIAGKPAFIRRARGFVPEPIELPTDQPPTLAVGGHLKNTICLTRGREAFVTQHVGDLDNAATYTFFEETISHWSSLLDVTPEIVACDLHPDFQSTRYAEQLGLPLVRVQHHHAHVASVAGEYGISGGVLGLALDGYGFGLNGDAWGGELLSANGSTFQRLGSFKTIPLPGGDVSSREPWRIAFGIMCEMEEQDAARSKFSHRTNVDLLAQLVMSGLSPRTSSAGRLFDAVAAILGVSETIAYESEAAMKLEALVDRPIRGASLFDIQDGELGFDALFQALVRIDDPKYGAELFHGVLIDALVEFVSCHLSEDVPRQIVLSGGCFHNRVLSEGMIEAFTALGVTALYPRKLPPGDGGISFGQALVAGQASLEGVL